MSLKRMIISAVTTKPVFRRFAQMSDEDKAAVVEKVKEKMNGGATEETPATEEAPSTEETEGTEEMESLEDVGTSQEATKMILDGETDDEAKGDKKTDKESPAEGGGEGIDKIVDDLITEVEEIKSDGEVTTTEVLGLIDNMVQMVQSLLTAKPARARKSAIAARVRDEVIADRIVEDIG